MTRASGKRQVTNRADALLRLRDAREFHEVGSTVRATKPKAAITLFVHAGIAASDAICGMALGEYWRGDSHTGATGLLGEVTPDGKDLAKALRTLLGMKDESQYSTRYGTGEALASTGSGGTTPVAGIALPPCRGCTPDEIEAAVYEYAYDGRHGFQDGGHSWPRRHHRLGLTLIRRPYGPAPSAHERMFACG